MENQVFRDMTTTNIEEAKVILTGVPYDKNASVGKGASLEPSVMRELSTHFPALTRDGIVIKDYKIFDNGDIEPKDDEDCATYFNRVEKELLEKYKTGKFNFIVGGDHSIAIASEKAFYDYAISLGKEPVIIHIDAHPDICNEYEGSKYSHACPNKRAIDNGYKTENVSLIGIRGFEEQEVIYFAKHPEIKVYTASYIQEKGYECMLKELIKKYSNEKYMVYLSYDIDANDPCYAPGTGTPEAFGLPSLVTLKIILGIVKNLNVQAMDLVEISPKLDINDITTWLGLKTMYEVFNVLNNK